MSEERQPRDRETLLAVALGAAADTARVERRSGGDRRSGTERRQFTHGWLAEVPVEKRRGSDRRRGERRKGDY